MKSKKSWKLISTDIKTDVKQDEINKLITVLITFHTSQIEIQYKAGLHFSFNLGWHSIQFDPLSVTKDICRRSLSGWQLSLEFKVYLEKFVPSPRDAKVSCNTGAQTTMVNRLVYFHVIRSSDYMLHKLLWNYKTIHKTESRNSST